MESFFVPPKQKRKSVHARQNPQFTFCATDYLLRSFKLKL